MKKLTCSSCESIFKLNYEETDTIANPVYCPFCGENIEDDYPPVSDDPIED